MIADAYQSQRWDASQQGEVDRRLGIVHRREWKKILNAAPYYQTAMYAPTTDGNGNVPLTALSSGSGDALRQLYRIIAVYGRNFRYEYVDARNWIQSSLFPTQDLIWYLNGANIVLPNAPSTLLNGVFVNWVPQRFDQLATDQSVVSLPPDYDDVFSNEGAAALLMKGAAEAAAAAALRAEADTWRQDLLADLARVSTTPASIQYESSSLDWGQQ